MTVLTTRRIPVSEDVLLNLVCGFGKCHAITVCFPCSKQAATLRYSAHEDIAFVFGDRLTTIARQFGASSLWAPNALWAVAFTGAFGLNAYYCLHHLGLQKSWSHFLKAPVENLVGGAAMGVLLLASILMCGVGADMLGEWGTSTGWAINMCTTVFAANFWGLVTGEWRGAPRRSYIELALGLTAITAAIILASPSST